MKHGFNREIFDSMFISPEQLLSHDSLIRPIIRGSPSEINTLTSQLPQTGTTILAFQYKDGLIFAADRKTSNGHLGIVALDTIKIQQADSGVAIGCAGLVSDAQFVKNSIERMNSAFLGQYESPVSIRGQANYLTKLCFRFRHFIDPWGLGLNLQMILGGVDPYFAESGEDGGGIQIFEISGDGCQFQVKKGDYVVIGSGTDGARGLLRENKKAIKSCQLSLSSAMKIAVKAIGRAGEVDNGTSDIRVATPNVAVITHDKGFKLLDDSKVKKTVELVLKQEEVSSDR
jgi:proteasome beta subunit